jgi:AcrR family transcriptional regulator
MMDNNDKTTATRRQPQQRRSRLLVASIREACLRILREGHPEELTVKRIAEVAGVTIGSFYQYYPNKEAVLLDVLLENAPDEAERIADETRHIRPLRSVSLPLTLKELIDVACERHLHLLALHGDIYRRHHRAINFHELVKASVSRYVEVSTWEAWVRELLDEQRVHIHVDSIEMAAFFVGGTLQEVIALAVDRHPDWLAQPQFRTNLLDLLLRYLQHDSSSPPGPRL